MALSEGLKAYYKLDENSGNSGVDTTGNGYTLADTGTIDGTKILGAGIAETEVLASWTTFDNTESTLSNPYARVSQSFPATNFAKIYSVELYLERSGVPSGNLQVAIFAADANDKPTGSALKTVSWTITGLTTSTQWIEFVFDQDITKGQKYCIVIYHPEGNGSNYVVYGDDSSSGYTAGKYHTSSDNGSTWYVGSRDMNFKVWAYPSNGNSSSFFQLFN